MKLKRILYSNGFISLLASIASICFGLLLGFILGPMLEEHLRRSMLLFRGDPTRFLTRPLTATLLVLAVACLVVVLLPNISRKRETVFKE